MITWNPSSDLCISSYIYTFFWDVHSVLKLSESFLCSIGICQDIFSVLYTFIQDVPTQYSLCSFGSFILSDKYSESFLYSVWISLSIGPFLCCWDCLSVFCFGTFKTFRISLTDG